MFCYFYSIWASKPFYLCIREPEAATILTPLIISFFIEKLGVISDRFAELLGGGVSDSVYEFDLGTRMKEEEEDEMEMEMEIEMFTINVCNFEEDFF